MNRSYHASAGESISSSPGIEEIAGDWISRRDAGLNPAEEKAFQAWLTADPRHAGAVEALQPVWSAFNRLRYSGRGSELRRQVAGLIARKKRRRQRIAISSMAAAAVITFGFLFHPLSAPEHSAPTVALRPDRLLLPDGSTVELNFGTEIVPDFTPETRRVGLLRGEALFQVAKNDSRPFVVAAGHVAVRAVGTAFTVRLNPKRVDVLVTEGRVAVDQKPVPDTNNIATAGIGRVSEPHRLPSVQPVFLSAGRRIVLRADPALPRPVPHSVSSAEVATALAWRNRRIEFNGTPLGEAVKIFNRDNAVQLSVANSATGELRISGVYWTNDPEAFSRVVKISLGLDAVQTKDGKILLRR